MLEEVTKRKKKLFVVVCNSALFIYSLIYFDYDQSLNVLIANEIASRNLSVASYLLHIAKEAAYANSRAES